MTLDTSRAMRRLLNATPKDQRDAVILAELRRITP